MSFDQELKKLESQRIEMAERNLDISSVQISQIHQALRESKRCQEQLRGSLLLFIANYGDDARRALYQDKNLGYYAQDQDCADALFAPGLDAEIESVIKEHSHLFNHDSCTYLTRSLAKFANVETLRLLNAKLQEVELGGANDLIYFYTAKNSSQDFRKELEPLILRLTPYYLSNLLPMLCLEDEDMAAPDALMLTKVVKTLYPEYYHHRLELNGIDPQVALLLSESWVDSFESFIESAKSLSAQE